MIKKFLKRYLKRQDIWSIGIYMGDSPCYLSSPKDIENPVLTAKDVTDREALFVADPFMVYEQNGWHMFFEVLNRATEKGEIGLAVSRDGKSWKYQQIVLSEPFHLSYPYVFKWQGEFYMVPESHEKQAIRLYQATSFPYRWEFRKDLLRGFSFVDSSLFHYDDRWWLFTCPTNKNDVLTLFYASNLWGPWIEHPANPIVKENVHIARCGGRITKWEDKVIRYAQDDYPNYGSCLYVFEITKLTDKEYEEIPYANYPVLKAGKRGWNKDGMHHIDPHCLGRGKWIVCVDGQRGAIELKARAQNEK